MVVWIAQNVKFFEGSLGDEHKGTLKIGLKITAL